MNTWQVQEAKARFSELLEKATEDGPQVITRHGKSKAVLLDYETYELMRKRKPTLAEILTSGPKFDEFEIERIQDGPRDVEL